MKTNAANGSREPAGVTTLSNDLQRDTFPANGSDIEMSASILNEAFKRLDPIERLVSLHDNVRGSVVFTTSFGLEDQALTHLIAEAGIDCRFATLDTGRLFPETYAVWAETEQRYGIRVEAFYPRAGALQALVQQNGVNGFYHSTEARHACCAVRKIEPLGRTLEGAAVWLTGLRADQSGNRQRLDFVSYETDRRLLKASPLLDWSRDRVAALVRDHDVPRNALHDKGFLSIGCAPCTRAVESGEPERAGRWWWEQDQTRECGLHVTADGRLARV
jgi:phosphoadenosine phosphosulfate reductase